MAQSGAAAPARDGECRCARWHVQAVSECLRLPAAPGQHPDAAAAHLPPLLPLPPPAPTTLPLAVPSRSARVPGAQQRVGGSSSCSSSGRRQPHQDQRAAPHAAERRRAERHTALRPAIPSGCRCALLAGS